MRWLGFVLVGLTAQVAAAQSVFEVVARNDTGAIDCDDDLCPLNLTDCEDGAAVRELILDVSRSSLSPAVAEGGQLFIWVEQASGDHCSSFTKSAHPDQILLGEDDLAAGDPFVSDATFLFPDDASEDIELDTTRLLGTATVEAPFVAACGATGVEKTFRVCFGVDQFVLAGTESVDDIVKTSEPSGFIDIRVDTLPPPTPTATPEAKDGRIAVNVEVTDGDDVDEFIVRARTAPDGATTSAEASDCLDWKAGTFEEVSGIGGSTSATVEVEAKNGQLTQGCAFTVDEAGNQSGASAAFLATPIDQCDFIECYPDELKDGCAATTPSLWLVLCALVVPWALGRNKRGTR